MCVEDVHEVWGVEGVGPDLCLGLVDRGGLHLDGVVAEPKLRQAKAAWGGKPSVREGGEVGQHSCHRVCAEARIFG